jgi:hypothetical protein
MSCDRIVRIIDSKSKFTRGADIQVVHIADGARRGDLNPMGLLPADFKYDRCNFAPCSTKTLKATQLMETKWLLRSRCVLIQSMQRTYTFFTLFPF